MYRSKATVVMARVHAAGAGCDGVLIIAGPCSWSIPGSTNQDLELSQADVSRGVCCSTRNRMLDFVSLSRPEVEKPPIRNFLSVQSSEVGRHRWKLLRLPIGVESGLGRVRLSIHRCGVAGSQAGALARNGLARFNCRRRFLRVTNSTTFVLLGGTSASGSLVGVCPTAHPTPLRDSLHLICTPSRYHLSNCSRGIRQPRRRLQRVGGEECSIFWEQRGPLGDLARLSLDLAPGWLPTARASFSVR
jgi:hypothetical protein